MMEEILNLIAGKINALPNISCNIGGPGSTKKHAKADALLQLQIQNQVFGLNVHLRNKIVPAQIPKIVALQSEIPSILIATHYITPTAQKVLIKKKIPYVDTAGNFFFSAQGIYIQIQTEQTSRSELDQSNRAFTKAGLKVVYHFLTHPDSLNDSYRKIGGQSKVTIDTVGKVIKGLLQKQYILQAERKVYRMVDKEKLLHKWVTEYNQTLRPKLKKRKFRWVKKNKDWKQIQLPEGSYWGGAAAGELLTDYLIADTWTLYTEFDVAELINMMPLVPDIKGDVEIVERFWKDPEETFGLPRMDIVHPLLVYADLIEDSNLRYVETAEKIYKAYVENNL